MRKKNRLNLWIKYSILDTWHIYSWIHSWFIAELWFQVYMLSLGDCNIKKLKSHKKWTKSVIWNISTPSFSHLMVVYPFERSLITVHYLHEKINLNYHEKICPPNLSKKIAFFLDMIYLIFFSYYFLYSDISLEKQNGYHIHI